MATEKRLIDANALKAEFTGNFHEMWHYTGIRAMIDVQPTVDAMEVVHGRWVKNWCNNSFIGHEYAECSVCDCHMLDTNQFWNSKYCPNCGAKMDGDENG